MKIGDKVIGVGKQSGADIINMSGKIIDKFHYDICGDKWWLVHFDIENNNFHNGTMHEYTENGKGEDIPDKHGLFCLEKNLKLVDGGGKNGRD